MSPRTKLNQLDFTTHLLNTFPQAAILCFLLLLSKLTITIGVKDTNFNSLQLPYPGKFHTAGDVYSFGVILLEILTGLENRRIILAKQAIRNDKENIAEMIDPDLENSYPLHNGIRMCELIKQCLDEDPKKRPSMQQVVDNFNAISQV